MTGFQFTAEYAKSGRASCKGCSRTITNKSLRVGVEPMPADDGQEMKPAFAAMKWYHPKPKCLGAFRKTPGWWEDNAPEVSDFQGLDGLEDSDQSKLTELLEELREGKGVAPKAKAKAKKPAPVESAGSEEEESEDEDDEEAPKKKEVVRKARAPPAKKAKKESEDEEDGSQAESDDEDASESDEPKKKVEVKASRKRAKRDEDSEEDESEEDSKPAKKAKRPAPKKAAATKGKKGAPVAYVSEALEEEKVDKINELMDELSSKNLTQLKAMCIKNNQKQSGTKAEVLERIAEGNVLGALPKCEECGGNLKYAKDDGTYSCSGKYEDGAMKRCSFKADSLERIPWK